MQPQASTTTIPFSGLTGRALAGLLQLPFVRFHRVQLGFVERPAQYERFLAEVVGPQLASLPNFSLPGDLSPSARYWTRDIVAPAWTMDDEGMVHVPLHRSGLGVDIDVEYIENLTVRREELRGDRVQVAVS